MASPAVGSQTAQTSPAPAASELTVMVVPLSESNQPARDVICTDLTSYRAPRSTWRNLGRMVRSTDAHLSAQEEQEAQLHESENREIDGWFRVMFWLHEAV